ncbi:MAG: hypothetical protein [Caudoviricetes sp.]|nr:MAG: hypothetical protein [Caudoviricetes sp.]
MKAQILKAVPAAGKTKAILENILKTGEKSIVASISRQLSRQSYDYYQNLGGTSCIIDSDHLSSESNVRTAIEKGIQQNDVIFITHSALLQFEDYESMKDFHLYIDEVPEMISLESFSFTHNSNCVLDYCESIGDELNKQYGLKLIESHRNRVEQMALDGQKDLDNVSKSLFPLYKALLQELPVNVTRTDQGLRCYFVNDLTVQKWSEFKSVTIACANFEETLTGVVLKHFADWKFEKSPLHENLLFQEYKNTNRVDIHVLCEQSWSRYLGDQEVDGKSVYNMMQDVVLEEVKNDPFIYTKNSYRTRMQKGTEIPYNPHGLNMYKKHQTVAALFCYNPLPWQIPLLKGLAESQGLDENILIQAFITSKYLEPVFQLCLRSDIRNYESDKKVRLFVPDMRCVDYLADNYLKDANIISGDAIKIVKVRQPRSRPGIPGLLNMKTKELNAFKRMMKKDGLNLNVDNHNDIVFAKKWLTERRSRLKK